VNADVPHQLLLVPPAGTPTGCPRVILMPRQKQGASGGALQVALAESCGLGIYYEEAAFKAATDDSLAALLVGVSLPEEAAARVRAAVLSVFSASARGAGEGTG
jgi:hypothetical protein